MIGIYKIVNKINGKIYIGQSNDIERRWREHLCCYCNPNVTDYNSKKYRAFRKYGIENFELQIIEEVSKEKLNEREIYWIQFYNSVKKGYNLAYGGSMPNLRGEDHSQAILTQDNVNKIMYYLEFTEKRFGDIGKQFNITSSEICHINNGNNWISDEKAYPLRKTSYARKGEENGMSHFTDEEVLSMREMYQIKTIEEIQEIYKDRVSKSAIKHILTGDSYKHVPVYKKNKKMWIEACID